MSDGYRGSAWRKWDLHVHSPASYEHSFPGADLDEQWQNYLNHLASLDGISVLGITDYCTVEGYWRVREHFDAGKLSNLDEILPNIEFRLTESTGEGKNVNIHVVASPKIADDLPEILLSNLKFEYRDEQYACTREQLVEFGRAYVGNPDLDKGAALSCGAKHFRVTREHIVDAFRKSEKLRRNALVAVPNSDRDGASGFRESGQRAVRLEIYRMSQVIVSANPRDREFFLGRDGKLDVERLREEYGGPKPCIGGSDAHRLEEIGQPDAERHTWIKADTTFEGLAQICFEPEHRVHIGPLRPNQPIHRIDGIKIHAPADAALEGEEGADPFCLRGERELLFAPGLTCVIGGRGTGKSTLLSLLQEAATGESDFFRNKRVSSAGRELFVPDLVELSISSSAEDIEFLDQNQIEAFALDSQRLTNAVYSRLQKLDEDGNLAEASEALAAELDAIRKARELVHERTEVKVELRRLRKREDAERRLVTSLEDERYTDLLERAEELNNRISAIRSARERLNRLITGLEDVVGQYSSTSDEDIEGAADDYDERRAALVAAVLASIEKLSGGEDLTVASAAEISLLNDLNGVKQRISGYLAERGISEENARDLALASDRLSSIREAISQSEERMSRLENEDEIARDPTARERFERALQHLIEPINEQLTEGKEEELRRISIEYEFDTDAAIQSCQRALIEAEIEGQDEGRQLRDDYVASALDSVNWEDFPTTPEDLCNQAQVAQRETVRRLIEHLSKPGEFEQFKLLVERHLADALKYKRIEVLYDGRRLQQASFGQRCSAALIILLMMGNQPIVIDEPEAHLDSALIATSLVDLIKLRMSERQIIFATHNANFVVNGDSELVHVLSLEGDEPTQVESTSLENPAYRQQILRLEGGSEAFALRERRYGFTGPFARSPS